MTVRVDVASPDAGASCATFCHKWVEKWTSWGQIRGFFNGAAPGIPCALLVVPQSFSEYEQRIGAKSRNMLRKVRRLGYGFNEFDYNRVLDDVHDVNTSMPVRSGGPMRDPYKAFPKPQTGPLRGCDHHRKVWLGGFANGRLRAYVALALVGELAVIDSILGHKEALPDGVMNGLIGYVVTYCMATNVKAINYLALDGPPTLVRFKRSVGFVEEQLALA